MPKLRCEAQTQVTGQGTEKAVSAGAASARPTRSPPSRHLGSVSTGGPTAACTEGHQVDGRTHPKVPDLAQIVSLYQSQTKIYSQEHLKPRCGTFSHFCARTLKVSIKTNLQRTRLTVSTLIFTTGVPPAPR